MNKARIKRLVAVGVFAAMAAVLPMDTAAATELDAQECKLPPPPSGWVTHSGFPFAPDVPSAVGTHRAVVLFVDFPDRPATISPSDLFDAEWPGAADYVASVSHGQLDVVTAPHFAWLRMGRNQTDYQLGAAGTDARSVLAEAIALADSAVDFSTADAVWVLNLADSTSGEAWHAGHPSQALNVDGNLIHTGVLGRLDEFNGFNPPFFNSMLSHEVLHTFGLPDLYDWERDRQVPPEESNRFVGNFSHMGTTFGLIAGLGFYSQLNGNELTAWENWQLGWITDDQVVCMAPGSEERRTLSPASTVGGDKAVVVRTGPTTALVAEARMQQRWDAELAAEGVLVYSVDSAIDSGDGPLQVQGEFDELWPDSSVLVRPGENLVVGGYTMKVLDGGPGGFDVAVYQATCQGQVVTIDMTLGDAGTGTPGDDVILGTAGDDVITGLAGDDYICSGGGDDIVDSGPGADWVRGGGGNDTLLGGDGDDRLFGVSGNDTIMGGDGDDTIHGNLGDDTLYGEGGEDRIFGYADDDTIMGGDGDDRLHGNFGEDVIWGEAGNDIIIGYGDNDVLHGGAGNDKMHGNFGDDLMNGDDGDDTLFGYGDNDVINGGFGRDTINGNRGNDTLNGNQGNDQIKGADGDDELNGGRGDDVLEGNSLDDTINGGPGNDSIDGGTGTDTCFGGTDTDTTTRCEPNGQ